MDLRQDYSNAWILRLAENVQKQRQGGVLTFLSQLRIARTIKKFTEKRLYSAAKPRTFPIWAREDNWILWKIVLYSRWYDQKITKKLLKVSPSRETCVLSRGLTSVPLPERNNLAERPAAKSRRPVKHHRRKKIQTAKKLMLSGKCTSLPSQ